LKGGVALSQGNQSFLRFSLEESVWFQRGQEVEELVSISLDPNITIQENDQYVTIRGSLDLTGEYKRQNEQVDEDNQFASVQKWVHSTSEREDGICEFSHQFPVDITIPTYRVRDLSEIDVIIETFDYVLPEKCCLKLTADLNISGLYGEQSAYEVDREDVQEEVQGFEPEAAGEKAFELAYRSNVVDDEGKNETGNDADYESFEVEARKEDTYFTEPTLAESSSYQQVTPEIHFAAFRNESPQDVVESPQMAEEAEEVEVDDVVPTNTGDESPESPNVIEKLKKKLSTSKKSMSIAEFLARKEGDDHAKLKVCIVQNGESAEVLAERYAVSVQQLLKVNNLEPNQDVYEGQVLYVPSVVTKR
jgi:stage VI sporulation protein D